MNPAILFAAAAAADVSLTFWATSTGRAVERNRWLAEMSPATRGAFQVVCYLVAAALAKGSEPWVWYAMTALPLYFFSRGVRELRRVS